MATSKLQTAFKTVYSELNTLDDSNQNTVVKDVIQNIITKRDEKIKILSEKVAELRNELIEVETELAEEIKSKKQFIAEVGMAVSI